MRALKEELTRRGGSAAGFVEKADLVKAVVAARAAAAVQSHPPRPPVEPRIVNGRPRGLHSSKMGMQGAPMMQSSPRSASVGVSTR